MGEYEINAFLRSSTYSFDELKEIGRPAFPTLDALMVPPRSVVMPWEKQEYLNPGVIPPAREVFDYIADLIDKKQESAMLDLLQPSVKYPGATKMADLREEANISIIEGKFQVSIDPVDLVKILIERAGMPEPRDLPSLSHSLTVDISTNRSVISIVDTVPYAEYNNTKQRLSGLYSERTSDHGLLWLTVLAGMEKDEPPAEDDIKMYMDLYDVDEERMRKNYDLFTVALNHKYAIDSAELATDLEMGWKPTMEKRIKIQQAMLQIAQPALDAGIVLSKISYNAFAAMDLQPEPEVVPFPEPEGGGSIKA